MPRTLHRGHRGSLRQSGGLGAAEGEGTRRGAQSSAQVRRIQGASVGDRSRVVSNDRGTDLIPSVGGHRWSTRRRGTPAWGSRVGWRTTPSKCRGSRPVRTTRSRRRADARPGRQGERDGSRRPRPLASGSGGVGSLPSSPRSPTTTWRRKRWCLRKTPQLTRGCRPPHRPSSSPIRATSVRPSSSCHWCPVTSRGRRRSSTPTSATPGPRSTA